VTKPSDELLIAAVQAGDVDRVRTLLASGANANARAGVEHWRRGTVGWPALTFALGDGNAAIVRLLLDAGADVNTVWSYETAGERCIEKGEKTALISALQGSREDIALDLVARGANVNAADTLTGESALQLAAASSLAAAVEQLLARGARDVAALTVASANGHAEILRRLLDAGLRPDARALIAACREGRLEIAATLLDAGVDVNARSDGTTPLAAAAWTGQAAMVEWLFGRGADLAQSGAEALFAAANSGRIESVRMLLKRGVPVDARNSYGWTSLMTAAWQGQTATVRCLIEAGADASLRDSADKRAVDWARQAGHAEIVELLEHHEPQ
jgi:ankyrin repeat protein